MGSCHDCSRCPFLTGNLGAAMLIVEKAQLEHALHKEGWSYVMLCT